MCKKKKKKKKIFFEVLYLDMEDLIQSNGQRKGEGKGESYSLPKEPIGCISPSPLHPQPHS